MRETLRYTTKATPEILEETLMLGGFVFEECIQRSAVCTLLKSKTSGEARNIVLTARETTATKLGERWP